MGETVEPLAADDPWQIGPYRLRARLGAGGMGQVYLGYSPAGRAVAVKVIHRELAKDPMFRTRFRREVAAARAVSGAYTAPVTAAGPDDDPPWLATAFVPGPSLGDAVAEAGALPELAVWKLAAGLVEALQAVHASGLVHRDLKPANVLLAADGPRLIDFGISQAVENTRMTSTGLVVGTASFMSPEQAQGSNVGRPSDVFSLGSVIAFAALGTAPFGDGPLAATLYRVVNTDPVLDGIPAGLRKLVAACLAKTPAERPTLEWLVTAITVGLGPDAGSGLTSFWPGVVSRMIVAFQDRLAGEIPGPTAVPNTAPDAAGRPLNPAVPLDRAAVPSDGAAGASAGPGLTVLPGLAAAGLVAPAVDSGSTAVGGRAPAAGRDSTVAHPAPSPTPTAASAYASSAAPNPTSPSGPDAPPGSAAPPGSVPPYPAAGVSEYPMYQGMPVPTGPDRQGGLTRRKLLVGLGLTAAVGAAGAVWELSRGGPPHQLATGNRTGSRHKAPAKTGAGHPAAAASGHKIWAFTAGNSIWSSVVVADGVVYFGSDDSSIYAVNVSNGSKRWSHPTNGPVRSGLAVAGGAVYAGSYDGKLYALNASHGGKLWVYPADSIASAGVAVADGKVYSSALGIVVVALRASTGAKVWEYAQGGSGQQGIAVADHVVYAGSSGDEVYALRGNSGNAIWSASANGPMSSGLAVVGGTVFAGSDDQNVYALDASNGSKLWTFPAGAAVESGIAVANGIVYVGSDESTVYALSATHGGVIWKFTTQSQVHSGIAVANGRVYVGSSDAHVYALNATTGREIWAFATEGPIESGIAVADGVVYFGSTDNNLYAVQA
jgi:outer membrane protein assembly factor BamB/tRNA A-37 threonylcarbamoyl transferase component Bud32